MTEVSSGENVGVDLCGAERRGEVGAMACEIRIRNLLGCYRGTAGLLGLAGAGLDHVNVGSCPGEENEDEWPDLESLIRRWPRDVGSAQREGCSRADAVGCAGTLQSSQSVVFCQKGLSGHGGRVGQR